MRLSDIKKVYVFEYRDMFKIGISCDVKKRLEQMKVGCPGIIVIYESDYIKNCFYVERLLHDMFKAEKIGGEWFSDVSIELIDKTVKEIGEVVDMGECKRKAVADRKRMQQEAKECCEIWAQEKLEEVYKKPKYEVDTEKGWKFTEKDKPFLIWYFEDLVKFLEDDCCGDGVDEACLILNILNKQGVEAAKEEIQSHASDAYWAVDGEIDEFYAKDSHMLRVIKNSFVVEVT